MENAPFHASIGIDGSRQHRYHAAVHGTEMSNAVAARARRRTINREIQGGLERHICWKDRDEARTQDISVEGVSSGATQQENGMEGRKMAQVVRK